MKQQAVKFITLGCKVNQYEEQAMIENAASHGWQDVSGTAEACDFVVINTCTVTADADKNSRYWIRRMKRENPAARLVVTGCYVEKNRAEIEAMPEVDLILSNYEKDKLVSKIFEGCGSEAVQGSPEKGRFAPLAISQPQGGGTRAFIKIQDGCNHSCSFCKVVLVRGRSRSREMRDVIDEVRRIADAGYKEIVLAGIQLGAYGLDFESPEHFRRPAERDHYFLADVIESCAEIPGIERIRLSSIEPVDIGEPLIQCFERVKKFCPQMHIPLQSGDSEVLARMNRRYSREFYRDLIFQLRGRIPDFELTLDVLAGFAGEETHHFENTLKLLEEIEPLKCHVFPYSRREGTRAAAFEDVPPHIIRERVRQMSGLAEQLAMKRMRRYVGREMDVLVEAPRERGGMQEGLTANYLRVCFPFEGDVRGKMMRVQMLAAEEGTLLGRAVISEARIA